MIGPGSDKSTRIPHCDIINLKGNNTSANHKNIIPPYVSFHIMLENMLLKDYLPQHTMFHILIEDYFCKFVGYH